MNPKCWSAVLSLLLPAVCIGQWSPASGQWGRTDARDLRVMTWNVRDAVCSTSAKAEGANNWCAVARIIASMKPDVLIMQECGDNSGNGTGGAGDSQSALATTLSLLVNGGPDPFRGGAQVGAYIRKYDASLTYPHVYASGNSDGFNRNVILSRHPFAPTWPGTMQTTVTLTEEGPDCTRVTVKWIPYGTATAEEIATFVAGRTGMTGGWTGSFDKLEALIESMSAN